MLAGDQYNFIVEGCEGMELDAIWDYFSVPFGTKFMPHDLESFDSRREGFLWVVERLVDEGRVILVDVSNHVPLEGCARLQIERFRQAFPKNDAEMDRGLWFFSADCPGGVAWQ
nr:DUF596 domain-containing protein [Ralstonia pseudosolanacearum]